MRTPLDSNGQPTNQCLQYKSNRNKACSSLIGILQGLICDKTLNDIELQFLHHWVKSQDDIKQDVLDIYDAADHLIRSRNISTEDREDLLSLLRDCIEYSPRRTERATLINEFLGFIDGISADSVINVNEFNALNLTLKRYGELLDTFPVNVVKMRMDSILLDGRIDEEELSSLCTLLKDICGTDFTNDGDAVGGSTTLFNDEISTLTGLNICLTGSFIVGTRKKVEMLLREHSNEIVKNVTNKTDMLIIGTLSSRDWLYSSIGTKISRATELKDKGRNVLIVSERALLNFLNIEQ